MPGPSAFGTSFFSWYLGRDLAVRNSHAAATRAGALSEPDASSSSGQGGCDPDYDGRTGSSQATPGLQVPGPEVLVLNHLLDSLFLGVDVDVVDLVDGTHRIVHYLRNTEVSTVSTVDDHVAVQHPGMPEGHTFKWPLTRHFAVDKPQPRVIVVYDVPTRRFSPDARGRRVDMRATLRAALRSGGSSIPLKRRSRKMRHPPLVILCDISGSMSRYSRMILHFIHAITSDRDRVYSFVFGTRLTNITRYLRQKDVDVALDSVSSAVYDWSGGTRIGETLALFNKRWARRVLGQGAMVLLITDGLDRDGAVGLAENMDRLHRSCRRLIWLNPLLRWSGFEPKSQGIRAMLPHVDEFRPIHNLSSLRALVDLLSRPAPSRASSRPRPQ